MLFSLLSIFLNPPLFGILLFVVRNDKRISFKQYYRPYNNPYSPFGNPTNPYGQQYQQPQQQKPQEDPFPEFSDKGSQEKSNDTDDLFS